MINTKSLTLLVACFLVTACSGTLYTIINPDLNNQKAEIRAAQDNKQALTNFLLIWIREIT